MQKEAIGGRWSLFLSWAAKAWRYYAVLVPLNLWDIIVLVHGSALEKTAEIRTDMSSLKRKMSDFSMLN